MRQLRLRHRQRIEAFAQQFDLTTLRHQISSEQLMERSAGRSGPPAPHILGERLFRRLDEDASIVRAEREIRIEFQQLVNEPRDLTAASVAGCDPERAQERQFEYPVLRKKRCSVFRITDQTILSGTIACVSDFSSGTYVPWRFRVKRRDLEVHVEGRLGVNSVAVARQAAIEGLALVQTPPIVIAGDLAARRLVTVLDEWAPTPATGFFLYYPSRRQMRPALKALVDFLRKERRGVS